MESEAARVFKIKNAFQSDAETDPGNDETGGRKESTLEHIVTYVSPQEIFESSRAAPRPTTHLSRHEGNGSLLKADPPIDGGDLCPSDRHRCNIRPCRERRRGQIKPREQFEETERPDRGQQQPSNGVVGASASASICFGQNQSMPSVRRSAPPPSLPMPTPKHTLVPNALSASSPTLALTYYSLCVRRGGQPTAFFSREETKVPNNRKYFFCFVDRLLRSSHFGFRDGALEARLWELGMK
ncbi:unnamed protein product [Caenorhabditis auriculariae]|uniref:Uncharacterized protein n=1 Tax=Caenorhabditis auriculariae TaxID=2777116 RepID=A0A8S1HF88_9PELO|nr:unnamed protein product [Caenorhabditis auriculariae]